MNTTLTSHACTHANFSVRVARDSSVCIAAFLCASFSRIITTPFGFHRLPLHYCSFSKIGLPLKLRCFANLLNSPVSQVTPRLKSAVKQHLLSYLLEGAVSNLLVMTSPLLSMRRRRVKDRTWDGWPLYTEHPVARIFLMRTVCQVVLSGSHRDSHTSCLAQVQDEALCVFQNSSHLAQHVVHCT